MVYAGVLTHWSKGFCCAGVEGEDVCAMLQAAIARRASRKGSALARNVQCVAVLNDTVGTLMSCAITAPHCRVGAIFGVFKRVLCNWACLGFLWAWLSLGLALA